MPARAPFPLPKKLPHTRGDIRKFAKKNRPGYVCPGRQLERVVEEEEEEEGRKAIEGCMDATFSLLEEEAKHPHLRGGEEGSAEKARSDRGRRVR